MAQFIKGIATPIVKLITSNIKIFYKFLKLIFPAFYSDFVPLRSFFRRTKRFPIAPTKASGNIYVA